MRASLLALPALIAISIGLGLGLGGCSVAETASRLTLEPQRASAADLAAKTDVSNAKTAVIAYQTNDPLTFPTVAELGPWGYTASEGVPTVTLTGSGTDFCLSTTSETGTAFHAASDTNGISEGTCP